MMEIKEKFAEKGIDIPIPPISLYSGSETISIPSKIVDENYR
jgi:hypothetical protein